MSNLISQQTLHPNFRPSKLGMQNNKPNSSSYPFLNFLSNQTPKFQKPIIFFSLLINTQNLAMHASDSKPSKMKTQISQIDLD